MLISMMAPQKRVKQTADCARQGFRITADRTGGEPDSPRDALSMTVYHASVRARSWCTLGPLSSIGRAPGSQISVDTFSLSFSRTETYHRLSDLRSLLVTSGSPPGEFGFASASLDRSALGVVSRRFKSGSHATTTERLDLFGAGQPLWPARSKGCTPSSTDSPSTSSRRRRLRADASPMRGQCSPAGPRR